METFCADISKRKGMTNFIMSRIASLMAQFKSLNGNIDQPEASAGLLVDMLIAQISDRRKGSGLIARAQKVKKQRRLIKEGELARLYLLFEQYLSEVESDSLITRNELRHKVSRDFSDLLHLPAFNLIFQPTSSQRQLLCAYMLEKILSGVRASFVHGLSGLIDEVRLWIREEGYSSSKHSPQVLTDYSDSSLLKPDERLRNMCMALYETFCSKLGEEQTRRIFTGAYEQTASTFKDLDTFPAVIDLLPEIMLDDDKISLLSRKQIQSVLHAKIENLQRVNDALSEEIGKRNKITRKLRESEHFLSSLVNSSMDAVVAMNEKGEITEWNKQAEIFFGWTRDEILGKVISQTILPDKDRKGHVKWFENYLSSGQSSFINRRFEFKCIRKDGTMFDAECCIAPMVQEEDRFFSVFIRDITSRKEYETTLRRAKDQAESAARAKSEFLAVMSHEIRTPLNGVLGMAQMLHETSLDTEQDKYVNMITASGNNLNVIINDILDISKIEVGKMDLEHAPFDFVEAMINQVDLFTGKAVDKNLQLHFYSDPEIPQILIGDQTRIGQVVINLLSNAIKFTDAGNISVRIEMTSHTARFSTIHVSVADSGIGIAQEQQQNIFGAFSQEDSTTSRRFGGTGLGLAICSKLVALMGGKIWVDSVRGEGSTFTFSLHLEHEDANPATSAIVGNQDEMLVCVGVSDATCRNNLVAYLASSNIQHESFEDDKSFFQFIQKNGPSHIIIDPANLQEYELGFNSLTDELSEANILVVDSKSRHQSFNIDEALVNVTPLPYPCSPTNFYLRLQGNVAEESSNTELLLESNFSEAHPLRILVAEDNEVNQMLIKTILNKLGYEIDLVENGIEACAACGQTMYDLIFMDVQMPEMDGITATLAIRETFRDLSPRIVALTANASLSEQEQRKAEFDAFLSKPFQFEDLLTKLKEAHALIVPNLDQA